MNRAERRRQEREARKVDRPSTSPLLRLDSEEELSTPDSIRLYSEEEIAKELGVKLHGESIKVPTSVNPKVLQKMLVRVAKVGAGRTKEEVEAELQKSWREHHLTTYAEGPQEVQIHVVIVQASEKVKRLESLAMYLHLRALDLYGK